MILKCMSTIFFLFGCFFCRDQFHSFFSFIPFLYAFLSIYYHFLLESTISNTTPLSLYLSPISSNIIAIGCKAVLRMGSISNNKNDGPAIAVTDNGNYIVDLFFTAPIADVALAAKEIKATVGKLL